MKHDDSAVFLTQFKKVQIAPYLPQDKGLEFFALGMAKAQCIEENIDSDKAANQLYNYIKSRIKKYGVHSEYIKQRQIVTSAMNYDSIPDRIKINNKFVNLKIDSATHKDLFKKHKDPRGILLNERMELYEKIAMLVLKKMYAKSQMVPDDIIHVSCSGYMSPSPVETWVSKQEWSNTTVTHSYHMGCYGCLPAIRMAHGFMSSSRTGAVPSKTLIDIIHTELLSLHIDILNNSAENIVTMSLFADGFVKYSAVNSEMMEKEDLKGFKILAVREHLLPKSIDDMTWKMGAHHFHMTLSPDVPVVIKKEIRAFASALSAQIGKRFDDIKNNMAFAIHPGGPKIVDNIRDELGLSEPQVEISRKVLKENGNMSSATIPFILSEILNCDDIKKNTIVLCLAFGPGLTAAGMLLEKI